MKKKKLDKSIIKGRWYNINKKIKKRIIAKYHRIKDWRMDPKGYFLILINIFSGVAGASSLGFTL